MTQVTLSTLLSKANLKKAGTFSGHKLHKRYRFCGMNISIENRKGSIRHWKDDNGNEGQTKMLYDYGYIRGSEGRDGDHVDAFIGPNEEAPYVFVVHQNRPDTGKYDEDKVMLGFDRAEDAKRAYLKHYDSIKFFGGMKAIPIEEFKERVSKTLHGKKSLKAEIHKAGRKDVTKLTKKVITNKRGKKQTVYVRVQPKDKDAEKREQVVTMLKDAIDNFWDTPGGREKAKKYQDRLKSEFNISYTPASDDKPVTLDKVYKKEDFRNFDNFREYAEKLYKLRLEEYGDYKKGDTHFEQRAVGDFKKLLNKMGVKIEYTGKSSDNAVAHVPHGITDKIYFNNIGDENSKEYIGVVIHELGHILDHKLGKGYSLDSIAGQLQNASSSYVTNSAEVFADNFLNYMIHPEFLKKALPKVYNEMDRIIPNDWKKSISNFIKGKDVLITDTPAFRKWFGDSKVVDDKGEPLVMYHGTDKDLTTIEPGYDEPGAWFTSRKMTASGYAKGLDAKVYSVYLKAENPLRVPFEWNGEEMVPVIEGLDEDQIEELGLDNNVAIVKYAKSKGYDSVHFPHGNFSEDDNTWVVFSANQIKSATENKGTFDPNNPDMTKARAVDSDKDLSANQIKQFLLSQDAFLAYAMKPAKVADHLKVKIKDAWYEVEPFYKYDDNGHVTDLTIQLNGMNGSVVPTFLRGQFSISEWNNLWAELRGQYTMIKAKPVKYKRRYRLGSKWVYVYDDPRGMGKKKKSVQATVPWKKKNILFEDTTKIVVPYDSRPWVDKLPHLPDQTIEAHYTKEGEPKPERKKLHDAIVKKYTEKIKPVPPDKKPVAIMMMGGPASGKSSMVKESDTATENFVQADADAIKGELPEYREAVFGKARNAAFLAHEESSDLVKRIRSEAIEQNKNIVIDGTGGNIKSYIKNLTKLREKGYHVRLMLADMVFTDALPRAVGRAEKTGRYVPEDVIESAYDKISQNFLEFSEMVDEYFVYDTRQRPPSLIISKIQGQVQVYDRDKYQRLLDNSQLSARLQKARKFVNIKDIDNRPPAQTAEQTMRMMLGGLRRGDIEMKRLDSRFTYGEGIEDVVYELDDPDLKVHKAEMDLSTLLKAQKLYKKSRKYKFKIKRG